MSEDTPTTNDIIHWLCGPANAGGLWNDALEEKFHSWLDERDRQMLERGYDEGKSAEELAWMHCFDGHPVPEGEVCDECRTDNPYRKERDGDCY